MLRKTRRTAKQRAWLKVKQRAPIGVPSRPSRRATDRQTHNVQKRLTHDLVWARDACCRYCHGYRTDYTPDQMHHDPPLSATRGRPPEERTNTRTCVRVCVACHAELTGTVGRKMTTQFLSDRGFDGPIKGVMLT